jgi:hypothetical protein
VIHRLSILLLETCRDGPSHQKETPQGSSTLAHAHGHTTAMLVLLDDPASAFLRARVGGADATR